MDDDVRMFTRMSEVAYKDPKLKTCEIIKSAFGQHQSSKRSQSEIEMLYSEAFSKDFDSGDRLYAEDVVQNITDSRFAEIVHDRPVKLTDATDVKASIADGVLQHLMDFKSNIQRQNDWNVSQTPQQLEALEMIESIIDRSQQIDNAENNLQKLIHSMNHMKSLMENFPIYSNLSENIRRDVIFETNMKKVCQKIAYFNQYIESVKTITAICKENYSNSSKFSKDESELPPVIARLLKDVESTLISEVYDDS